MNDATIGELKDRRAELQAQIEQMALEGQDDLDKLQRLQRLLTWNRRELESAKRRFTRPVGAA